ncbi:MAG: c-type cytochrome [Nannocystaceae bacterium]|nr:c-type cytochrome [Nannocystaceae bacterium]
MVAGLGLGLGLGLGCGVSGSDEQASLGFPTDGSSGKTDIFGRALVGVAAPYTPDPRLADDAVAAELDSNVRSRREQAWQTVHQVLQPVPLLGLAEVAENNEPLTLEEGEVPTVPRWETWYGIDDIKRMFQGLYGQLTPAQRQGKEPFSAEQLQAIEVWNAEALDRSKFWPLERYLENIEALFGECGEGQDPEACAIARQSNFSGAAGGIARITYSPGTTMHVLGNYAQVLDCIESVNTLPRDTEQTDESNFSHCFDEEFPADAVLVKAQWSRVDFEGDIPVFDTSAEALTRRLGPGKTADWGADGDRRARPDAKQAYTISLRSGSTFRLTGLHIMTKELRHWQWITLWWSDTPDDDFGADRPDDLFGELPSVWGNYKMCAVTSYEEGDADPAGRYPDFPSLGAALAATAKAGQPSWCSNPYVEHGRGNARTNCIGCHQHGGAVVDLDWGGDSLLDGLDLEVVIDDDEKFPNNGRAKIREVFPADYLWSFSRVDDFSHVMLAEVDHVDHGDNTALSQQIDSVLALEGAADIGQIVFSTNCASCHGEDGSGGFGPSLFERVPARDDQTLLTSILIGLGDMPAWGEALRDQELADVHAFLRDAFE